jgi:hypothetical protein
MGGMKAKQGREVETKVRRWLWKDSLGPVKSKGQKGKEFQKLKQEVAPINHFKICKIHQSLSLIHTLRFKIELEESGKPFHKFPGSNTFSFCSYH